MKRRMVTAVALVLGLSVAPAAYASTVPDESAGAGATMQYVALDSMSVGPTVAPDTNSETAQETAAKAQDNADGSLSAPAGPQVMNQVQDANVPKAMDMPAKGAVSQIDPNAHNSFMTAPITSSIPSAISFLLVLLLCLGAGVGAAVVISIITGKKITLGVANR